MGLNISVYRRRNLSKRECEQTKQFDPDTGAPLDFDGQELPGTVIFDAHLGNISLIASVRDILAASGINAPILTDIFADGTRAGGHIPLEQLPLLVDEIDALRPQLDNEILMQVMERIDQAAQAGISERNCVAFL